MDLVAGRFHVCALTDAGQVLCWGSDRRGELGDGPLAADACQFGPCSLRPQTVPGLPPTRLLSGPSSHTCAVGQDGSLWCWGYNSRGALGNGSTMDGRAPSRVPLERPVDLVAPGFEHTCAGLGGEVWCWGSNISGELGDGTRDERHLPARVPELDDVVQLASGTGHSCALRRDQTVWCWGWNEHRQLGVELAPEACAGSGLPCTTRPARVPAFDGASFLAAGHRTTCVIRAGRIACTGELPADVAEPVLPEGAGVPVALDVDSGVGCLRTDSGRVFCWGADPSLFGPEFGRRFTEPVEIPFARPARVITLSEGHACALLDDGAVHCWGENNEGMLGDGTKDARSGPTPVAWPR